jgi:hypothetical protein
MYKRIKEFFKGRYGRGVHATGCNPVDGGSIPPTASKDLHNISRQLERIADLYERELQIVKTKEGR